MLKRIQCQKDLCVAKELVTFSIISELLRLHGYCAIKLEADFWLLGCWNKVIDVIKLVGHFLGSTTDTQE